MTNPPASNYLDIGVLGEDLVVQCLVQQRWSVIERRWRCRWGEIDIIARFEPQINSESFAVCTPILAFIEVKTRSRGNWDVGGLLAITPQKQAKLWRSANCYLATVPHLADYQCRFDVALVYCQRQYLHKRDRTVPMREQPNYQLVLQEYIPGAFS